MAPKHGRKGALWVIGGKEAGSGGESYVLRVYNCYKKFIAKFSVHSLFGSSIYAFCIIPQRDQFSLYQSRLASGRKILFLVST